VAASGVVDGLLSCAHATGLVDSSAVARATITTDAKGVIASGARTLLRIPCFMHAPCSRFEWFVGQWFILLVLLAARALVAKRRINRA
jgi:hypothetical protein